VILATGYFGDCKLRQGLYLLWLRLRGIHQLHRCCSTPEMSLSLACVAKVARRHASRCNGDEERLAGTQQTGVYASNKRYTEHCLCSQACKLALLFYSDIVWHAKIAAEMSLTMHQAPCIHTQATYDFISSGLTSEAFPIGGL